MRQIKNESVTRALPGNKKKCNMGIESQIEDLNDTNPIFFMLHHFSFGLSTYNESSQNLILLSYFILHAILYHPHFAVYFTSIWTNKFQAINISRDIRKKSSISKK